MTETSREILKGLAIVLGVIVLIICIGGAIYLKVGFKTYLNIKDGFQIMYPSSWTEKTDEIPGLVVCLASPKENAFDDFIENVSITYQDLSKQDPLTLKQYADLAKLQMEAVFKDMTLKESRPVTIAGRREGYKLVFQGSGDLKITLVVYVFMDNNVAYNITYAGMTDHYQKTDKYIVELMMLSLKVLF